MARSRQDTERPVAEHEELKARVNKRLKRIGREYKGTSRICHIATLVRDEVGYDAIRESVRERFEIELQTEPRIVEAKQP